MAKHTNETISFVERGLRKIFPNLFALYRWQTTVNKWTDDDVIDKNPFVSIFGLINNVWCIFPSQRCSFRTQQTIFTRNIQTKEFTSDEILMLYVYSILPLKKIILLTIFFCLFSRLCNNYLITAHINACVTDPVKCLNIIILILI